MKLFIIILIISLLLIAGFLTGLGASCQSQKPVAALPTPSPGLPPAPSPGEPPLPPSERWAADGVIDTTEYLGEMNYGDYEIYWSNDSNTSILP